MASTQPQILTFADAMQMAQDFLGVTSGSLGPRDTRGAVQRAHRELTTAHTWSFLKKHDRVQLQAAVAIGTVAYDHSGGGTCERQLTLTGSTWPSWTNDNDYGAAVKIGDAMHLVQSYQSSTILQLDPRLNPGVDVAAGTSYTAYPFWYRLPNDFVRFNQPWMEEIWAMGIETTFDDIVARFRYHDTTGRPQYFCVQAVPELHGAYGLYLWPPDDSAESADFVYERSPRQLRHDGVTAADQAGTVSVASDMLTVTGSGTSFAGTMEGALMRFGTSSNVPTGLDGIYPFAYQQTIETFSSTTGLTLAATLGGQPSAVKYIISDVIDLDAAVHEAFLACVRKQLAVQRNMKDKGEWVALYQESLKRARNADHRGMQIQIAQPGVSWPRRLKDQVNVPAI